MRLKNKNNGFYEFRWLFFAAAAVVVFVTTYSLILPAITMEKKTFCGIDEHEHTDECYNVTKTCVCGRDEIEGHEHTDSCFSEEKILVCENDAEEHVHEDECYEIERILTCGRQEVEGHTHEESCFEEESELICGQEEHIHAGECFVDPDAEPENVQNFEDDEDSSEDPEATEKYYMDSENDDASDPENDDLSDPEEDSTQDSEEDSTSDEPAMTSSEDFTEENTEEETMETDESETAETEMAETDMTETETAETETMAELDPELEYPEMILKEKIRKGFFKTWIEIEVHAPEGALPEGSSLLLEEYEPESIDQAEFKKELDEALFGGLFEYKAVKITFSDAAGMPVAPLKEVQVYIKDSMVKDAENVELVQIDDRKDNLKTDLLVLEEEENANIDEDVVTYQFWPEDPSVLAVASTTLEKTLTAEGPDYNISVDCGAKACVPAGASLKVKEIQQSSRAYNGYISDTEKTLDVEEENISYARFFDITIVDRKGKEIQPKEAVDVKITLDDLQENIAEAAEAAPQVVHFGEGGDPETVGSEQNGDEVSFAAEGFSVYGVVYTVDFHYEVNGNMYEFSLPGGGFVTLKNLVEVLGITGNTSDAENEDDDAVRSEAAGKFVAEVAAVEFSSPELVWVGKADADSTVGELKEANGLECRYSAELTEEQIAEINSSTIAEGDWALISLQPFVSEETLKVTMTNGDQFTVRVTDAQISTHVITADGADFLITVTYGDDAQIQDGAILEADEIVPGTKEYEDYLAQAQAAISGDNRQDAEADNEEENSISFARFFDIRIMAGGVKIEPAAPVQVTVTYADAINVDEAQRVYAVHFAEKGTEVIRTSSDEDNKSVVFMQDSFSVTGTIVTSGGEWPDSGSSYVMYVKSGNNYYAVAHDGSLHQVSVSGNQLTFPDEEAAFDQNNYLWTYEEQSSWQWWLEPNRFVFYHDAAGKDHYLSPASASGIGNDSVNLGRDNNGRISASNNYIGIRNGSIIGQRNQQNAVSIQFASLPKTATIHFVDRNGDPLTGVAYKGSDTYPVTANADGTFTVPYNWNMGNTEYTLHLDKDFSKTGYTYASTHLAGTRQGTALTYNGLTIDAALKERNNTLYYYTDAGDNRQYGSLLEKNINNALSVPKNGETDTTSYVSQNVNKDIYVILDPVPSNSAGQEAEGLDVKDPEFNKTLEYNEDGTYTLSLNVKGHGINAATNPKANVLFVVDTSSSMDKTEGTGTGNSRLHDTKPELKTLAKELLLSNTMTGKDPDTVEISMISFDGGVVDEIGWTKDYDAFKNKVDNSLKLHRGTDWEDALQRAYEIGLAKQAAEPDQQVFVVFFTDGEASQYTNFHGKGTYNNNNANPDYQRWYNYFLSRESAKDEARAIVRAGMQFYSVYAFNQDGLDYNGEKGSDLLRNLVKYAYNSDNLGSKNFFANATSTAELQEAFNSILLSIREFLGFSDVVMNDDITSLTSTGINLVSSAVGGFTYTRSGGRYGEGTAWTGAPAATHTDTAEGDATSVQWNLGSVVLEEGITYTVSFKVWPNQEAYDWLANLQNGTKTWADVVAAGLDAPNGSNPQIVKNGDSYSLLTNKPSLDSDDKIINNVITYKKIHSETVAQVDVPAGTPMNTPIEGRDSDGNKTITTYTLDQGVYTKTVTTEKKTYFPNPDPMPLVPERMNVLKDWQTSMNTSHPADQLKFRVLVDGKYYQNNGSLMAGDAGVANAKVLPVSRANSWTNSINIAPGIVKYFDDDGNALSEALVLETGHKYTLEEFDLMEGGSAFLYYTSYEFHSQTMRPMIVDGTLKYLVLIDQANPKPDGAETCTIGTETYYVAASGSGQGTLSGTNYRTAELDITKIIENNSGAELTEEALNAETFTYRVTLRIPDGTDPAGIVGYEYVPRTTNNAYTLFGYQEGETAFATDIERFSGKTFRAWNTLVYRDLVEWEDVGGRIISKTDDDGNILWKVEKDAEGYHNITYDMTLNRNEVIRFTNLPTGTKYSIQEIYANYYQADNSSDSAGHAPIDKVSNIAQEGYEITQVLTTNGTQSKTTVDKDTVSGTIDTPNVRYYNQFTNSLQSVKTQITILKVNQDASKPLPGAVFDLYDKAGYEAEPKAALKTGLTSSGEAGKEGTIDLGKLPEGIYYLVETSAPAGYIPLADPVIIIAARGDVMYDQVNSSLDNDGTGKTGNFQIGYQLKVVNDEGAVLPSTGGPGTMVFSIFGSILAAGAGLLLWRRRAI